MIRRVAVVLLVLMMSGCATKAELIALPSLNSQKRSFDFFDMRPQEQFDTRTQRQQNGDLVFYGDDVVIPSRTELLADQLQLNFAQALKGKTVTVSSFSISTLQYTNRGGPNYSSSGNPVADLIGVAIGKELMAATTRSNELQVATLIKAKIDEQEVTAETRKWVSAKNAAREIADHLQVAINEFTQKVKDLVIAPPKEGAASDSK